MKPSLSIVIPVLNAEASLSALLPSLQSDLIEISVVVCDGGSVDQSASVAADLGAHVVSASGGRGPQLQAGARAASGDWIFLLHADSQLQPGWDTALSGFIGASSNLERAAYFQFALDDPSGPARRLERMVAWRCRTFGLPYGDQGLVLHRSLLEAVGGMPEIPLMEDVALVRKIGRERLTDLSVPLVTSARKFRRQGYWRRSLRNLSCLALYFLGVPPAKILRLYQ